jgi:TPR repeat protein
MAVRAPAPSAFASSVQADPAEAREWYERAAQLGSDAASQRLAKLAESPQ